MSKDTSGDDDDMLSILWEERERRIAASNSDEIVWLIMGLVLTSLVLLLGLSPLFL